VFSYYSLLTIYQYNETINDLLGSGDFDKKKHEIKHDKGVTRVTDVVLGI
jgi:kinesin family protein C1